jgi:hypothetical protein
MSTMNLSKAAKALPSSVPSAFSLSPAHFRFLLLEQGVGAAVVNFVLNGLVAWASYRTLSSVPFLGPKSIVADTIATSFALPIITCLIAAPTVRKRVAGGSLQALPTPAGAHKVVGLLPEATIARGLVLGFAAFVCVGCPALAFMSFVPVPELALRDFLLFKAAYAAVLGALVTPVAAIAALALAGPDTSPAVAPSNG